MNSLYILIADAILVAHFAFILFVVGGQVCVIIGYFRGWSWIRKPTFRVCHLLAIGIVVTLTWANQVCPLTVWENALRDAAGGESYSTTFVEHWVGGLIFYDAPRWAFTMAYTLFGALVLLSWSWVKPEGHVLSRPTQGGE